MPNYGTARKPIYSLWFAMKGKNGGPSGVMEATNVVSITTMKNRADPAGSFEIVLDGTKVAGGRTWNQILSPNDYVEIALGVQSRYPTPVPVMRGFIDNVRIVEDFSATPPRQIIVNGRDYGKVWLVVRMLNIYPPVTGNVIILQLLYGFTTVQSIPLADFFTEAMEKIVRPYIHYQQQVTGGVDSAHAVKDFAVYASQEIDPSLVIPYIQYNANFDTVYNFLQAYQNDPWFEMFVRDEADMPHFYLRWGRTRTSDFQQVDAFDKALPYLDTFHTISFRDDVVADNVGETDNEVFNYFFTANQALGQIDGDPFLIDYVPGQNPYLIGPSMDEYGARPMTPSLTLFPLPTGGTEAEIQAAYAVHQDLSQAFNTWLVKMYGFTEKLENGTIACMGWPDFRVGDEVWISDTDISYYCEGVMQQFVVNGTYTMQLSLTHGMPYRAGTGFGVPWDQMTPYSIPVTYPNLAGLLPADFVNPAPPVPVAGPIQAPTGTVPGSTIPGATPPARPPAG